MSQLETVREAKMLLQHGQRLGRLHAAESRGSHGERFNLFQLLGIGHLEVSTHSSLLRDLLDPEGTHGQGDVFLRRFIEVMQLPQLPDGPVQVQAEVSIGAVTEDNGGRLDLVVSCGPKRVWMIENKLFAAEQSAWVSRYLNHAPDALLIFLTLDGRSPENVPSGERPRNLLCRSYGVHVAEWIIQCRKEAAVAPTVRESLTQYLQLILELTQQSPKMNLITDLTKAATESSESLKAFFELRAAESEIRRSIIRDLQGRLDAEARKRGLTFSGSPHNDYGSKGEGFEFSAGGDVRIRFEFDKGNYQDFAFGFVDAGKLPNQIRELLRKKFETLYVSPRTSATWPAWIYWTNYQNWSTGDVFVAIRFGDFVRDVMMTVDHLLEIQRSIDGASKLGSDANAV